MRPIRLETCVVDAGPSSGCGREARSGSSLECDLRCGGVRLFIQQIAVGEAMATAFWLNPLLPGGVIASRDNFVVGVEGVLSLST